MKVGYTKEEAASALFAFRAVAPITTRNISHPKYGEGICYPVGMPYDDNYDYAMSGASWFCGTYLGEESGQWYWSGPISERRLRHYNRGERSLLTPFHWVYPGARCGCLRCRRISG